MIPLVLALLAATVPSGSVVPALIRPAPQIGQVLVIGTIDRSFSKRMEAALDTSPLLRTVMIESGGGLDSQAYRTTRLLNARGITVRVIGKCASACALLWAGADNRQLRRGALIGLHAVRPAYQLPDVVESYAHHRRIRLATDALRSAGFPRELVARGLAVPHDEVLWLDVEELRSAGVQFRLIERRRKSPDN